MLLISHHRAATSESWWVPSEAFPCSVPRCHHTEVKTVWHPASMHVRLLPKLSIHTYQHSSRDLPSTYDQRSFAAKTIGKIPVGRPCTRSIFPHFFFKRSFKYHSPRSIGPHCPCLRYRTLSTHIFGCRAVPSRRIVAV